MYKIWYFNNNFQNIYRYMYMYTVVIKLVFLLFVLCCSSSWSACIYNKIQLGESRSVCTCNFGNWCRMFKEGGVHPFRGLPNTSIEKKLHKTFGNLKIHLKILVSNFILWSQFIRLILNPQNIKCMDAPAYSCGTWFEKFILINIHVYWDISPFRVCWLYCWIKSKN